MHKSFFSYNLSKPYPYKWFTWITVIGGVAFTILFSIINFAANGSELSIVYTNEPNKTQAQEASTWYQKESWSFLRKISPLCQAYTVSVGSYLYTNNTLFPYLVRGMYRQSQNRSIPIMTLAYSSDYLRDCKINTLDITLQGLNPQEDSAFSAFINCTLYDHQDPVLVQLQVDPKLDYWFGISDQRVPYLDSLDPYQQPSLYWGYWMMSHLLYSLWPLYSPTPAFANLTDSSSECIWSTRDDEIAQIAIFRIDPGSTLGFGGMYSQSRELTVDEWASTFGMNMIERNWFVGLTSKNLTDDPQNALAWYTVLVSGLAQVLYSLILSDLGQRTQHNFLGFPERVLTFANSTLLASDDTLFQRLDDTPNNSFNRSIPRPITPANMTNITDTFYRIGTGTPQVNSTWISAQYLCEIARRKPMTSLIVSVLVADLVFLQAVWTIFNLVITTMVSQRQPDAMYCAGCAKELPHQHEVLRDGREDADSATARLLSGGYELTPVSSTYSKSIVAVQASAVESSGSSMRERREVSTQPGVEIQRRFW